MTSLMGILILVLATPGDSRKEGADLDGLAFMAGCWEGPAEGGTVEERYTPPAGDVILGTTRYLRDGRVTGYEFMLIEREGGRVLLIPYPGGRRSEDAFTLTVADGRRAVFEAPEHDFPRRIAYAAAEGDSLVARIDGGEGSEQAAEWRMGRISCDPRPITP